MDFIDLKRQQKRIKDFIDQRIQEVLRHGQYINGPEVSELEARLASYVGVKHALGCSSGTDALLMALMAFGVGPGDAIFTTPFTFVATAEVITLVGATPIFVDIDPATFNIDAAKLELAIEALKSSDPKVYPLPLPASDQAGNLRPRGVIPVDLFGLPADYDRIVSIAGEFGLFVIEDAAQAFGAEYKGEKACSFGNIGCTSFFPAKPLGCYGDGGMCFTDNDESADIMRSIQVHGKGEHKYDNVRIGINGRLDTLQAAILLAKLDIFPEEVELRQLVADRYTQLIGSCSMLRAPRVPKGYKSAWAQYSVLPRNGAERSVLQDELKRIGVPTAVYYPMPLHAQTAYAYLGYKTGDFPVSESISQQIFSLPMHPYLEPAEQETVLAAISASSMINYHDRRCSKEFVL